MDVGIGIPNSVPSATGPQLLEWARRAEAAGFSTFRSWRTSLAAAVPTPSSSRRGDRLFAEHLGPLLAEMLGPDRVADPQVSELNVEEYALASQRSSVRH